MLAGMSLDMSDMADARGKHIYTYLGEESKVEWG